MSDILVVAVGITFSQLYSNLIQQILWFWFLSITYDLVEKFSLLMAPKLKEMDDAVKMIYTSIILNQANNHGHTLLVWYLFFPVIVLNVWYSLNLFIQIS